MTSIHLNWLGEFRDIVNEDPELCAIGQWFDTPFSVTFGSERIVVQVDKGSIVDFVMTPRIDVRAKFGFSAPVEIWQKFFMKSPPAMYHDIFAMMMRVPEFVLEGDGLAAMQNARALHRMMSVMREVGSRHVQN